MPRLEVTKILNNSGHRYLEAPTGIGKSLGYLVPSALYLEKNPSHKIIIATATKNLQEQIIQKDWQVLQERFPYIKIASIKGQSNYILVVYPIQMFLYLVQLSKFPYFLV